MKQYKILIFGLFFMLVLVACTKLDENFESELQQTQTSSIPVADLLRGAYNSLANPFMDQSRLWAAQEHTTDEVIGPTRGPDWDDNGVWRVLHSHSWTSEHTFLRETYRELLQAQYAATNVLQFNPSAQQAAEARFIRALTVFVVADGWDQVPFRDDLQDLKKTPTVLKGPAALDFVISEVNAIMSTLPDGPAYVANKDGARVLLMKAYLNKGAFASRQNPTFEAADMNQVITLADQIINSTKYTLANNIFDNFAPDNDVKSTENIYTLYNKDGDRGGNVRSRWFLGLHYNMKPSGWNGFTTLSDFYNKFGSTDQRRGGSYPGMTDVGGVRTGFLVGQQFNEKGEALKDRKGNPLVFTPEVKLKETGANLEVTGIRVMKYPIDYSGGEQADNDYVIFRLADVMLMKAEALLRTNNAAGALVIVNAIRTKRGATPLTSLNPEALLDERGRELYWEGWRRQDLIRFGKFLQPWQEKPTDDPKYLIFPIPAEQLAVNPNLTQNEGY
ncbi:RagB/SusD family nutrient uptake outer membrane protein [Niastella caeni]|uniref:RagB/SusD family nutrient uptake outer membrane protein n=1 Tax=Niastella caeni TaxID=2569763 RepID=A0A4S8HNN9_9BACT|nr:RagB/SusD family nutrient uptake outer membrane protein [Niastella caeni]THU37000.1 RagB/SusD family nutrient uptake outer membrane protein [Niastella caeni]